jgi:hypothetical protein
VHRGKMARLLTAVGQKRRTTGIAACCARATSGHAVPPPSSVMNSRLLMGSPSCEDQAPPHCPKAVLCITAFWPTQLPFRVKTRMPPERSHVCFLRQRTCRRIGSGPLGLWLLCRHLSKASFCSLIPIRRSSYGLWAYVEATSYGANPLLRHLAKETFNFVAQKESRQHLGGFASFLTARGSGDLLPSSPPAEQATSRQDQTWKASTGDGTRDAN